MKHRLTDAILLLYPRRVRERHGPELMALIDDLIAHDRRSRTRLLTRLAVDGLVQRIASTATVWTVAAVLAATCFGGLAGSDFSAAHALQRVPRAVRPVAPARHAHPTPHHLPRSHHTPGRAAGMTTRRLIQTTLTPTVTRVQPGRGHPAADEDELAQRGKRNPGFRWASPLLVASARRPPEPCWPGCCSGPFDSPTEKCVGAHLSPATWLLIRGGGSWELKIGRHLWHAATWN